MKKLLLTLILLVQVSWSQTPIYEFNFNNSLLAKGSSTLGFTSYTNGAPGTTFYYPDRFGANESALIRTPNNTNYFVSSTLPDLPVGNQARTISFWVRLTDVTQFDIQHLVGYGENVNGESFGFSHGPNNTIRNYYWGNETNFIQFLKFGMWFHIAATYDPTSANEKGKLFINGKLVSTSNISINTNGTEKKIYIGRTALSGLTSDKGFLLDDLKIYNIALTNQQVFNDYHGANTTSYPTNNLLAYFNFENNLNSHNGTYKFQEASNNNIPYVNAINGNGVSFQQSYTLMNRDGISGSANLSNDLGNTEFTIAFWHYTDNITNTIPYPTLFEMNERLYYRHEQLSSTLRDAWGWLMGNGVWASKDVGFGIGGWHHVAIVHKASGSNLIGIKVYFDGVDYGMNTAGYNVTPLATSTLKTIYLGGGTSSNGTVLANNKRFNGKIDEAFFYNRALTQAEIIQLKNYRTFTCPTGNVTVTTQAQLNALAGCTTINGNLQINGSGITDFTPVNNITTVTGELSISNISSNLNNVFPNLTSAGAIAIINNSFTTFNGFNSLTGNLNYINLSFNNSLTSFSGFNTFSGTTGLDIRENPNLNSINALGSVTQISNFYLKNVALANLNFLSSLATVNGYFIVENCSSLNSFSPSINKTLLLNNSTFRLIGLPLLTNLNGLNFNSANCSDITIMDCGSLTSITPMSGISGAMTGGFFGNIFIQNNDALTSLNGLQNITSARSLFILDNQLLTNLSGLNSFSSTTDAVGISDNPSLTSLNGLNNLVAVGYPPSIGSNSMLTDISALNTLNLASTVNMASGQLNITNNSNLAICAVPWVCNYLSNANVVKNINSNAVGCESVAVVNTACAALSTSDFDLNEISLYPNPTNSVFNIEIPNEVIKKVEIYDVSGKKLLESNQQQIDVSSFATGIYMVQIQTESGKIGVSKLIKK